MIHRPRLSLPSLNRLLVVVVNLDKDRPGDPVYIALILRRARRRAERLGIPCVVCFVETKSGGESVHMVGIGIKLHNRRMVPVGDVGVHRDVEIAEIRLGWRRRKAGLATGHGPHRKSVATREDPSGQEAQNRYWVALKEDVLDDYDTVGFFGDLNNRPAAVAKIIGGQPFGAQGDVMGGTVRGGLRVKRQFATNIGIRRGFTGHREAWAVLQLTA